MADAADAADADPTDQPNDVYLGVATQFYVADQAAQALFRYDAAGTPLGSTPLVDPSPRGTASDPQGDTVWVIDASGQVDEYDAEGNSLGSWTATGVQSPAGIAVIGSDVWVLDSGQGVVVDYAGAADQRDGSLTATASFTLAPGDTNPVGLTTDGTTFWVLDATSGGGGQVFVYTAGGAFEGSWSLDPGQVDPAGITLDPRGGQDLWVADRGTGQVYSYSGGRAWRSGDRSATVAFALADGDGDPYGIADPAYSPLGDGLTAVTTYENRTSLPAPSFGPNLSTTLYTGGAGTPTALTNTNQYQSNEPIPSFGGVGYFGYGYGYYGMSGYGGPGSVAGFGSYGMPSPHGGAYFGNRRLTGPNAPGDGGDTTTIHSAGGDGTYSFTLDETYSGTFSSGGSGSSAWWSETITESYTYHETDGTSGSQGSATFDRSGNYSYYQYNGPSSSVTSESFSDHYTYDGQGGGTISGSSGGGPMMGTSSTDSGSSTVHLHETGDDQYSYAGSGSTYTISYIEDDAEQWSGQEHDSFTDAITPYSSSSGALTAHDAGSASMSLSMTHSHSFAYSGTQAGLTSLTINENDTFNLGDNLGDSFSGTGNGESDGGSLTHSMGESAAYNYAYIGQAGGLYSLAISGNVGGSDHWTEGGSYSGPDAGTVSESADDGYSNSYVESYGNSGSGNTYSATFTGSDSSDDHDDDTDGYASATGGESDSFSDGDMGDDNASGSYVETFWNVGSANLYSITLTGSDSGDDSNWVNDRFTLGTSSPQAAGDTLGISASGTENTSASASYHDSYTGTFWNAGSSALYNITVGGGDSGGDSWSDSDTYSDTDTQSGSTTLNDSDTGSDGDSGSDSYGDNYSGTYSTGGLYSLTVAGTDSGGDGWSTNDHFNDHGTTPASSGETETTSDSGTATGSGSDSYYDSYSGTEWDTASGSAMYSLTVAGGDSGGDGWSDTDHFSDADAGSGSGGTYGVSASGTNTTSGSDGYGDSFSGAEWTALVTTSGMYGSFTTTSIVAQYSLTVGGGDTGGDGWSLGDTFNDTLTAMGASGDAEAGADNGTEADIGGDSYNDSYSGSLWNTTAALAMYSLTVGGGDSGSDGWSDTDNFSDTDVASGSSSVNDSDSGTDTDSGSDTYSDSYSGTEWTSASSSPYGGAASVMALYSLTVGGGDGGGDGWSLTDTFHDALTTAAAGDIQTDSVSGTDAGGGGDSYHDSYSGTEWTALSSSPYGGAAAIVAMYSLTVGGGDSGSDGWSDTDNFSDTDVASGSSSVNDSDSGTDTDSGSDTYSDSYSGTEWTSASYFSGVMALYSLTLAGGDGGGDGWSEADSFNIGDSGTGASSDVFTDTDSGSEGGSGGDSYGDSYSGTAWSTGSGALYSFSVHGSDGGSDGWSQHDRFGDTDQTSGTSHFSDSDSGSEGGSASDNYTDNYSGSVWNTAAGASYFSLAISGGDGGSDGWSGSGTYNDSHGGVSMAGDTYSDTDSGTAGTSGGTTYTDSYSGTAWSTSAGTGYSLAVHGGDTGSDGWSGTDAFGDIDQLTGAGGFSNGDSGNESASGSDSYGDSYSGTQWAGTSYSGGSMTQMDMYSLSVSGSGGGSDGWSDTLSYSGSASGSGSGSGSDGYGGTYSGTKWNTGSGGQYSLTINGSGNDAYHDSGTDDGGSDGDDDTLHGSYSGQASAGGLSLTFSGTWSDDYWYPGASGSSSGSFGATDTNGVLNYTTAPGSPPSGGGGAHTMAVKGTVETPLAAMSPMGAPASTSPAPSGYRGGRFNPLNWSRWLYTGDANAPEEYYEAALGVNGGGAGASYTANAPIAHRALETVGQVPVVGALASGTNAVLLAAEGNHKEAALQAADALMNLAPGVKAAKGAKQIEGVAAKGTAVAAKAEAATAKGAVGKVSNEGLEAANKKLGELVPTGCFAGGTPLLTPRGPVPIEHLTVGDWVLAVPEDQPENDAIPMLIQGVTNHVHPVVGLHAGGQVLRPTAGHPLWVQGKGWTAAGDVVVGNQLLGRDGRLTTVDQIDPEGESVRVYNLRVGEYHTYFVGSPEWGFSALAHNGCEDAVKGVGQVAPPKDEVFRGLRAGEDPSKGLRARTPGPDTPIGSHVMGAKESNLISTTRDKAIAEGKFNSGNGVVGIDLSKVKGEVVDTSKGYGKGRVYSRTKADKEVLIRDRGGIDPPIPPDAIRIIRRD